MQAKSFYNLKLAMNMENVSEIVPNDLCFDQKHTVYILTGANCGGKTTITQAVGQLFILAQGGLFVPAENFRYVPCDCIYTHFPADEDKTMDLGRLGEECVRFKEMFSQSTSRSLILLNETFSTTSFEEGYYIAKDCSKAILKKGIRTIYNTHMHKLALDISEINDEEVPAKAASLVVKAKEGKRLYEVEVAPPAGLSYAKDIAEKYGVTFEMLSASDGHK
jgi:DNA mismatch repair ATPase MutS